MEESIDDDLGRELDDEYSHDPDDDELSDHVKTEDLHLYFEQSWKTKIGPTGIVILASFTLMLVMCVATLLFSYTPPGKSFLQNLVFYIF